MLETGLRPGYSAAIRTHFMNTSHTCVRLFYRFLGSGNGTVSIKAFNQDAEVSELKSVSDKWTDWRGLFVELPQGVYYVVVYGERGAEGVTGIALDDLEIADCAAFQGQDSYEIL